MARLKACCGAIIELFSLALTYETPLNEICQIDVCVCACLPVAYEERV